MSESRPTERMRITRSLIGIAPQLIAFAITLVIALVIALSPSAATADDWTLDFEENGIAVSTRPVPGSGIKEFRAIAEFESGPDQILAILRDSDRFKEWFPNTPESKLLGRDGDVSHQYSVMATPWPISDRDNVLRSVTNRNRETGVIDISVEADPDHYPENDDRVRVRVAKGRWLLEPLPKGRSRVTFRMHLEPGGGIPQWMINARVVQTPFEALTNLRAITLASAPR